MTVDWLGVRGSVKQHEKEKTFCDESTLMLIEAVVLLD